MSHTIAVPDDLYAQIADIAMQRGQPIERVVTDLLSTSVQQIAATSLVALGWSTASAEEIIAQLHASRVEVA